MTTKSAHSEGHTTAASRVFLQDGGAAAAAFGLGQHHVVNHGPVPRLKCADACGAIHLGMIGQVYCPWFELTAVQSRRAALSASHASSEGGSPSARLSQAVLSATRTPEHVRSVAALQ